jgi:phosphatidylserine/phosphatidylglycerophosphate/cardiolipin synthase-like enzyme
LKNTRTGDNRLIMGSANLSNQAFNPNTNQFENIHIFDNTEMTDIYEEYYTERLLPILSDYMPKELLEINKKRIKELKSSDGELLDEVILLNNTDLNKIKEKGVLQL